MTPGSEAAVVACLARLRRGLDLDGRDAAVLTAELGADVATGERLQLQVLDLLEAGGRTVGGWKVGWTSRGARAEAGAKGDRPFGFVLEDRILPSGSVLDARRIPTCKVEPEIALVLGARLNGTSVTRDEAYAAVAQVAPAFEICSPRLPSGMGVAVRVANGLNNWGVILGEPCSPTSALDDLEVELLADGERLASASSGAEVVDDPYLSLSRLASSLGRHGRDLAPGQTVITGSLTPAFAVTPGQELTGRFGRLGDVTLRLESA